MVKHKTMENLIFNFFSVPSFFCSLASVFLAYFGMMFGVKNLIRTLVSIEVMFLCISFLFVIASLILLNTTCQIFALFILALAACESALGLSLIILFFRTRGLLTSFETLSSLKG
jgi:NADH-quinone oxidoreductase subunit K